MNFGFRIIFRYVLQVISRKFLIGIKTSTKPISVSRIWTDAGSGADDDVKIYKLTPQSGYTCLGHVAVQSGTPNLSNYRCVRSDYVENVPLHSYATWDDRGSGAHDDFAAYDIQSAIDMGVFWSEARNSQPKYHNVPALKVQASVQYTH